MKHLLQEGGTQMPVSARSSRKGVSNKWFLDQIGLYQYDSDAFGILRKWEKSSKKSWWHRMFQHPAQSAYHPPFMYQFLNSLDCGSNAWTIANGGTGTPLAVTDKHGGFARSTNGASDNNFYTYAALSEIVKPQDGYLLWFVTTIMIHDVDQADFFIGLCAKLGSGVLFDNRVDAIGFYVADGSGALGCEARKNSSQQTSDPSYTLSDDTNVEFAFIVTGTTRVDFYVNNLYRASITSGLPDDEELALSFGLRNGQAAANHFDISTTLVARDF